jgi:hypothetical protein
MNPAQEATLAELVRIAATMGKDIEKMRKWAEKDHSTANGSASSGGTTGATATAAAELGKFSKIAAAANIAVKALEVGFNMVSSVLGGLSSIVGGLVGTVSKTAENLIKFAISTTSGTAKLADFYDAFRDLPSLLGTFAGYIADITRYFENMLGDYQAMSNSGASFSGSLANMRVAAAEAQMSLTELKNSLNQNSEIFSSLGGNVENGMRKFVSMQSALLGPNSTYSKELLGLGYTTEQVSQGLQTYIRLQGDMNKQGMQNTKQVAEGVMNVNKELDLYAKATGINREKLEADMKKASFDASWKQFTQGMSPEKAAEATLAVSKALQTGGEGAADLLKQMFMTGGRVSTPITEASKAFFIQSNGMAEQYTRGMYNSTMNMKAGSQEQLAVQLELNRRLGAEGQKFYKQFGDGAAILNMQNHALFKSNELMNLGQKTQTQTVASAKIAAAEAKRQQEEQKNGSASAFANVQQGFKTFGNALTSAVVTFLEPFATQFAQWGLYVANLMNDPEVKDAMNQARVMLTDIISWLGGAFKSISAEFKTGGFTAAFNEAIKQIEEGLNEVWKVIGPPIIRVWNDDVVPFLKKAFSSLFELIWVGFKQWLFGGPSVEELKRQGQDKKDKTVESKMSEADYKNKATDILMAERPGKEGTITNADIMRKVEELKAQYNGAPAKSEEVNPRERRASGTWGMTGQLTEPKTTVTQVEAGETVLTAEQRNAMLAAMNGGSGNSVAEAINRLNNLTAQLLHHTREVAQHTKRNVDATRALNGNLLA